MPKEEPANDLCRCCHSEGAFKNLYETHSWMDVEEIVYSKLLRDCLNIEMTPVTQSLQHMLCTICENCINQLQDANKFRKQVLKCEKRFRDVYGSCVGADTLDATIKEEMEVEIKIDEPVKPIDKNQNGVQNPATSTNDDVFNTMDDIDDDDGLSDHDDDFFRENIKGDEADVQEKKKADDSGDEMILNEVSGTHTQKRKRFKKKKPADVETEETEPADKKKCTLKKLDEDEELKIIQGMSVVCVKPTCVKLEIDFKIVRNKYQCVRCPFVAENPDRIRHHIRKEHFSYRAYKCPICFECFRTLSTLRIHKFEMHGVDDRFKCNACDRAYNSKSQIDWHMRAFHMLGKILKCEECGYETRCKRSLARHKVKHSTVKKYQCKHCQKTFKRKSTMQFHERIHAGDKRKTCTECGQAFVQRASLKYHMEKHHPGVDY